MQRFLDRGRAVLGATLPLLLGLAMAGMASGLAGAEPVTYFRSDLGRGAGPELVPVDLAGPGNLKWRCPLPAGHSSPSLIGDLILLTTFEEADQKLATVAVNRHTGTVVWERAVPTSKLEPFHRTGSPAAATVASDGARVYAFFGSYGILCYGHQGEPLWTRSFPPFQDEFGSPSSPIIAGERLLLNEDHDANNALYALDRRTGETVWRVSRDDFTRSYSTPVVAVVDGEPQVVVAGSLTLTGYSLATGERRWWVNGLARIVNPTPIVAEQVAYVATWSPGGDAGERITMEPWTEAQAHFDTDGDQKIQQGELGDGEVLTRFFRIDVNQDQGLDRAEWEKQAAVFELAQNSVMAIKLGGRGELPADRILWSYSKGIPYVASPLLFDQTLYLVKDGGILTTLDAHTGRVLKQGRLVGRGNYYASPIVAGGKVYLASENGTVTIVSATREWEVIASHDFGESIYATPVIDGGSLYVRTDAALYCFHQAEP